MTMFTPMASLTATPMDTPMARLMSMSMNMFMPMAPTTATPMTMGMPTAMSMFMAPLTAMNTVITMIMQAPTPWSLSKHAFSPRTTPKR